MRGSRFFDGVQQLDIEIGGERGRTPTFYYDGRSMTAVFAARHAVLRELMPDARYVPARLAPGLGVLAITCLEYRDTDIAPYNELGIAIPLNEPHFRANPPGRAIVEAARHNHQPSFVWHLPVTTDVALHGGVDFYNFPKFRAEIEFAQTSSGLQCSLSEDGVPILTLSGRPMATSRERVVDHVLRLWMDGQPQSGQFRKHELEVGVTRRPGAARVALGEHHPIALALRRILVSTTAIQLELCPAFEGILFGPDHLTLPLILRSLDAAQAVHRVAVPG